MKRIVLLLIAVFTWFDVAASAAPSLKRLKDGIQLQYPDYTLQVQVRADGMLRVSAAREANFFTRQSLTVLAPGKLQTKWSYDAESDFVIVRTPQVRAKIALATGDIIFLDTKGRVLLAEQPHGRTLTPAELLGEKVWQVRQQWQPMDEALYGLGQTQSGFLDLKGHDFDFWQHNTEVFIPFLVSSRGYGILWDNTSRTRFGDLRDPEPIPPAQLRDAQGQPGGLTGTYFRDPRFQDRVATRVDAVLAFQTPKSPDRSNAALHPDLPPGDVSVRWEGTLDVKAAGVYSFYTYSDGGVRLWIDGQPLIDHWRQDWLPGEEVGQINLAPGPHHVWLEWVKDQGADRFKLSWKTPSTENTTSLWSEAAEGLDYYFVYGPNLDRVVAGYRQLTGAAPMMPQWAFGLWQSRQRYETSQQSIDVVRGFRDRHIPFDNIVQDWFYWPKDKWGSHEFEASRFPDPNGWVKQLHDALHAHVMISVWGKFYPGTKNFEALKQPGYLYQPNLTENLHDWIGFPYTFYDAFIPEAQKLFWKQVDEALFRRGFDAWWLDATEPDLLPTPELEGQRSHLQSPAGGKRLRELNAYSLVQSKAVYEGQRASAPNQRVFILTRSGFAGSQRYAAATWSGDITSTWTAMAKQITAGLGFSISGMPYWTMDLGGFSVPARYAKPNPRADDLAEWRELNTRWFEFATFVPLLRSHGEFPDREMWEFGGEQSPAYQAMLKFDRLRYQLFPYIYSLSAGVTRSGGTLMRALVMDFPNDRRARSLTNEYLFGPAFLVSPITTQGLRERSVYLPADADWYDFWTGKFFPGGRMLTCPAPYDAIPLHIRAGTILPLGPEVQYIGEKPADPVTLLVYAGADGDFTLYEDDGLTYAYEKGAWTEIGIHWDNTRQELSFAPRKGTFPGMLKQHTFRVVLVNPNNPVPFSFDLTPQKTVTYTGAKLAVKL